MSQPTDGTTPDTEHQAADRSRAAQWGFAALAISALALTVGAYQSRLMQTQARASVWPYVVTAFSYLDKGETSGFDLRVQNNGVGPAIVRSVRVGFDGKPVAHWSELFPRLIAHGSVDAVLTGLKGVVIPPSTNRDTDIVALRVRQSEPAKALYEARMRLTIDICYCSIYDDCWIAHWTMPRPEQVAACRESDSEFDL